jgi:RES domain-containing protein
VETSRFKSWRSYWTFSREVARARRYIHSPDSVAFLDAVAQSCASRQRTIPNGWIAWRGQLGHDWRHEEQIDDEVPAAYPPVRMKPLVDRAYEGRVNAKGIPCLYMATKLETAISEVRPWIGSLVSVGQFRIERPLRILDCSVHHAKQVFYLSEPDSDEREQAVWSHIDRAFSEPMTRSDDTADYASTQVLAELFRDRGYDGVVYKSAFGEDGFNVALFDLDAAVLLNCGLYKVNGAAFQFSEADSPYFVTPKQPA